LSIIFFKLFQLTRANKKAAKDLSRFRAARDLPTAIKHIDRSPDSPSCLVAAEGFKEFIQLKKMPKMGSGLTK